MKYYYLLISVLVIIICINAYQKTELLYETMQSNLEITKYSSSNISPIIPLDIYQTWHTKKLPKYMKRNVEKLKNDNPEFNIHVYDDADCREFIKNNFDNDVLYAYDTLIPRAYKADLWRYCILYKKGGIYLDIKFKCVNGFKFIELVDKEYFVLEKPFDYSNEVKNKPDPEKYVLDFMCNSNYLKNFTKYIDKLYWTEPNFGINNGLIICKKNNDIFFKCINEIVKNVKIQYYGKTDISITGPILLGKHYFNYFFNNYNLFEIGYCIDNYNFIHLKKKKIIISRYPEYRLEQSNQSKIPNYSELWNNRNVYKIA